jgi:1,4-dihydroxy-2-naphthoyl-CoA hydrolase
MTGAGEPLTDFADELNRRQSGYDQAIGLYFEHATLEEVVAVLEVSGIHFQPYGVVHGGVYAGMVETACSVGAALNLLDQGKSAVGLENTTAFIRATRSGKLRCTARPLARGRRTQLWQAEIHDEQGRLVASGRLRLLVLDQSAMLDGAEVDSRSMLA